MPAHSQYVAFHCHFIQRLIHDTGPINWQEPLVIDSALEGHSHAVVSMLLVGVYQQGVLNISSAQDAWQMYKLADHLDCPSMLQQCREYINGSSGAALLSSSSADALEWIVAAHELGWEGLMTNCADSIATNFLTLEQDARFAQLPTKLSMLIMNRMVKQHATHEADVMDRVRCVLQKRSGRIMCIAKYYPGHGSHRQDVYKFFCDVIECPGHQFHTDSSIGDKSTSMSGTFHCHKEAVSHKVVNQGGGLDSQAAHAVLPDFLQTILQVGYESCVRNF